MELISTYKEQIQIQIDKLNRDGSREAVIAAGAFQMALNHLDLLKKILPEHDLAPARRIKTLLLRFKTDHITNWPNVAALIEDEIDKLLEEV